MSAIDTCSVFTASITTLPTGTSTIHYGYDPVGNRTGTIDATGTTTSSYDAGDQLQSVVAPGGTTSYGFDANGNQSSAGAWSYTFNLAGQLTAAGNGTSSVSYVYDGDGNRVTTSTGGQTGRLLWDSNFELPQLALERDSSGSLVRRYTYGNGRISMTTPQTTAYYSTDTLGTVSELSGSGRSLLGQYDTQPFGDNATNTNVDPSVAGNPFGFTGEYQDAVTGLYNLRARNYDPTTGRFLSPDPLGPQNAANTYTYVANNPLDYTDPSGMKRKSCGSLRCYFGSPKNFWTPLRVGAAAASCAEGFEVGMVAGPFGAVLGCVVVAGTFDIAAEQAKQRVENLGQG